MGLDVLYILLMTVFFLDSILLVVGDDLAVGDQVVDRLASAVATMSSDIRRHGSLLKWRVKIQCLMLY